MAVGQSHTQVYSPPSRRPVLSFQLRKSTNYLFVVPMLVFIILMLGYPIFVNGSEKYETRNIVYNFKTKKARISEVVTKQGDGFLHGNAVFKNSKNDLLMWD